MRGFQTGSQAMKRLAVLLWFMAILGMLALHGCAQKADAQMMNAQLIAAAERGDPATVRRLLQEGAAIDARDQRGRTPVMAATHGNHVDTVEALIQAGADINIRDDRMDNPFLYAGAEGLLDILKLTIAAGADTKLTNRYGGTALIPAAERGHVAVVEQLLTHTDVDVNHVNNLGWTALLEAIVLSDGGPRHQQIVQLLVDHGADVNIPDKQGVTPLQHARKRGFEAIERILVRAGGH
jgi:ankyrin repeat protein